MTKQDLYVQYILEQLQSGVTEPSDMVAGFCSKFQKAERTFWNYWNDASERHIKAQQAINEARDRVFVEANVNAVNEVILSRQRVLEMTSEVVRLAYDQVIKSEGADKSVYAFAAAVEKLNKLEGYEKPTKVASTDSEGKDKDTIAIIAPEGFSIKFPSNTHDND